MNPTSSPDDRAGKGESASHGESADKGQVADDVDASSGLSETFGQAMRRTALGKVAPGEIPTVRALLSAVGGVPGLLESLVPGIGFLVIYTLSHNLLAAVSIPVVIAIGFLVFRLVTKTSPSQAIAGIVVLASSAGLALITGRPENNFLFGMWINTTSLVVILLSIAFRWPLVGVIVGFLTDESSTWRKDRVKWRGLLFVTWLWAGLFAVRLIVELPLYFAHNTAWLAAARLATGLPLYGGLLWVTWMIVRGLYRPATADAAHRAAPGGSAATNDPTEPHDPAPGSREVQ